MANETDNTEEQIRNILCRVAQFQNIKNYKVFPDIGATKGEGYQSEFFTGRIIDLDKNVSIDIAIKKAPLQVLLLPFHNIYKNEVNFYSKIFPVFSELQQNHGISKPFNAVAQFLAGSTEEKNEFVAMENLKKCGYRLYNKNEFLDEDHLNLIFETYGRFHAVSFAFKILESKKYFEFTKNLGNQMAELCKVKSFSEELYSAFKAAMDNFDREKEMDILQKLQKLNENHLETLLDSLNYRGEYDCLLHGDCWSNNFLFKYAESGKLENIKVIDFQLMYTGSPVNDLCYFFYAGASKTDMNRLDNYLDLYYDSLCKNLREFGLDPEKVSPLQILKEDWKKYGIFGILMGLGLWVPKLMDQDQIVNLVNQSHLSIEKQGELWELQMTEVRKGKEFVERARNLCIHAVEYGIL